MGVSSVHQDIQGLEVRRLAAELFRSCLDRKQTVEEAVDGELLDAEDDLLALVARPEALSGWRRERLGEFCQRVGEGLLAD